jgi:hypothetical protein
VKGELRLDAGMSRGHNRDNSGRSRLKTVNLKSLKRVIHFGDDMPSLPALGVAILSPSAIVELVISHNNLQSSAKLRLDGQAESTLAGIVLDRNFAQEPGHFEVNLSRSGHSLVR